MDGINVLGSGPRRKRIVEWMKILAVLVKCVV